MPPTEQNIPTMPVSAPTPRFNNRIVLIVVAVVVLLALTGGGVYAWRYMHRAKAPVITPATTQVHEQALQALPQNTDTKNVTTQEKVNILNSLGSKTPPSTKK